MVNGVAQVVGSRVCLGVILSIALASCVDPGIDEAQADETADEAAVPDESAGDPPRKAPLVYNGACGPGGVADDYTGQCCTGSNWVYVPGTTKMVCCPPDTVARYDAYESGTGDGWQCGSVSPYQFVGISDRPLGQEGDGMVRWAGSQYWYSKSQWQAWGYPIYRSKLAALDVIGASYSYSTNQYYGNIVRKYRNGTTQVPYYKYNGTASWYQFPMRLYTVDLTLATMVSVPAATVY